MKHAVYIKYPTAGEDYGRIISVHADYRNAAKSARKSDRYGICDVVDTAKKGDHKNHVSL